MIAKHISQGVIKLSEIGNIDPFVRKVFLSWIAKSAVAKNHTIRTDDGLIVEVRLNREKMITLTAEDGVLKMPETVFVIKNGGEQFGTLTSV